ncbi:class I SAM-dependent methyltransferase [Pelosinus baikalensis]|uniref:Class I SAM-dependent methyltransferase n=1 Tax=Pelosinus baikalensis TaxID=2892015 RepID=A0ABS8HY44_9FIRM|nr:class I SAM-dependent methyltransferase [Pelosinus baikalensis]MCC5464573.1 class I SAM-dependent methyltransferase [Pelosinus baikalensis]MCC5467516.1 class I SAM-dependent methyltransferase [Pelosinus baikalensis]
MLGKNKPNYITWAKKTQINPSSRILDVGCGIGNRLREMLDAGFTNLTGVDPNIKQDIVYENKVKIYKSEIFDINDKLFDLIMLHHSFEHMSNPEQVLNKIYDLLPPNGHALIRIPVASSYAWRHYNINWVQLDAPRHLFLHTVKSIELLAKKAKFTIKDIIWDSSEFQFTGSESYTKGVPLNKLKKSNFSQNEIHRYREKAQELNLKHDGDQACFYLQKII